MDEKLISGFIADKLNGIEDVDSVYRAIDQLWDFLSIEVDGPYAKYADFDAHYGEVCPSCVTSKVIDYLKACEDLQIGVYGKNDSGDGYADKTSGGGDG